MEFFQHINNVKLNIDNLKELITIKQLPVLCASIDTANATTKARGDIFCIWGTFDISRNEIRHGVRFSLLNCPHALAWSITLNKEQHKIIIHCTIDKTEEDEDFIDSINIFVQDWSKGISNALEDGKIHL